MDFSGRFCQPEWIVNLFSEGPIGFLWLIYWNSARICFHMTSGEGFTSLDRPSLAGSIPVISRNPTIDWTNPMFGTINQLYLG